MTRVTAYLDGLNLYHAVHNLQRPTLKWHDVRSLVSHYLQSKDQLNEVRLYTTFPRHLGKRTKEIFSLHESALNATGVIHILGHFKKKTFLHSQDGKTFVIKKHEEKESDVNIAVDMLDHAYCGRCDKAILLSGDSDLLPAVKRLLSMGKRITVLAPPDQLVSEMMKLSYTHSKLLSVGKIHRNVIANCQLPKEMTTSDGRKITIPEEYRH